MEQPAVGAGAGLAHRGNPWAPGIVPMVVHSGVMVLCFALPAYFAGILDDVLGLPEGWGSWLPLAGFIVAVGFGVAAHNSYARARAALSADPSLRGLWLLRNLWWIVLAILLMPTVIAFALALVVLGRVA